MSANAQYSTPDPEWAAEMAKAPIHEPHADIQIIRKVINEVFIGTGTKYFKPQLPDASTYRVLDHVVPVADGAITRARTITPVAEASRSSSCIVWVHGGGFIGGSFEFDDYRMRIICSKFKMAVALLEYRVGPENPFPVPHRDGYDALKWVADNAEVFSADLSKGFILGGTSADGNIAATMAHRAQQDPFFEGRRLTGHILQMPTLIHPLGYPDKYRYELKSMNMSRMDCVGPSGGHRYVHQDLAGSSS